MESERPDKTTHPQEAERNSQMDAGVEDSRPPQEPEGAADEETGASPGTAQACNDLGLNSLTANLDRFGIKPPGQS